MPWGTRRRNRKWKALCPSLIRPACSFQLSNVSVFRDACSNGLGVFAVHNFCVVAILSFFISSAKFNSRYLAKSRAAATAVCLYSPYMYAAAVVYLIKRKARSSTSEDGNYYVSIFSTAFVFFNVGDIPQSLKQKKCFCFYRTRRK